MANIQNHFLGPGVLRTAIQKEAAHVPRPGLNVYFTAEGKTGLGGRRKYDVATPHNYGWGRKKWARFILDVRQL
jgi:hypothetical protein